MRPLPRTRKSAKWLLTIFALILLAATITSYWFGASLTYSEPSDQVSGSLKISYGILRWSRYWGSPHLIADATWTYGPVASPPPTWTWRFYDPGPIGKHVFLPLWIPAALMLLPAALLWRRDIQMASRARVGHCPACGYDRKGLPTDSKCPECGNTPAHLTQPLHESVP